MSSTTPSPGFFDQDSLDDSWFDLPRVDVTAVCPPATEPEDLEDSWFDSAKPR